MPSLFRKSRLKEAEEVLIPPADTHWRYRFWIPAFLIKKSYRRLNDVVETELPDKEALEAYRRAVFACKYGRPAEKDLRDVVEEAERRGIAEREELRAVLEYGDIRKMKDGQIRFHPPRYVAFGAYVFWTLLAIANLYLALLIFASPLHIYIKILMLVVFSIFLLGCGLLFNFSTLRSYRAALTLGKKLEAIYSCNHHQKKKLVLVK
ncbi:MAG: hypothetical protein AB2777_20465 [Candidatus Thiodiazotropha endolucinida]